MESNQIKRIQITKPPQFLTGTAEVFLLHFNAASIYLLKHKLLSKVIL